jgi:hypothetical protein
VVLLAPMPGPIKWAALLPGLPPRLVFEYARLVSGLSTQEAVIDSFRSVPNLSVVVNVRCYPGRHQWQSAHD